VSESVGRDRSPVPPGAEEPRRFRPRLRYELIGCGLHGHELLGTDLASIPPDYGLVALDDGAGMRWYRCLRCDSWLPLPPPTTPTDRQTGPLREVAVPLRGRPLRDRYVLRLIAVDRALHVLILGALAAVILVYATHHHALDTFFTRVLKVLQGGVGGPVHSAGGGIGTELQHVMAITPRNLFIAGGLVAAYAALEATEMVGLWQARRWAEYLTFLATIVFIPYEIFELSRSVSWLKALTLVINVAIAVYLLVAKRLFGLRGGGRAERAERERDTGWPALEAATPWLAARTADGRAAPPAAPASPPAAVGDGR
jgi:uncharacterized membrane protein (DUF2068 family)